MASAIPLHCNICPKKPNFSDVSHLLTHIASKGHLSNYYKVKVRSGTEDASRRLIEAYDHWYAEWNVEGLMSDRMNQKEKRRTRTRGAGRSNAAPAPKLEAPLPRSTQPRAQLGHLLDPRLSEQHVIKIEAASTPTPPPYDTPVLRPRGFPFHMTAPAVWPSTSRSTSRSYTNPDYETSSEYSDPSDRRVYRYSALSTCAIEDDPADLPAPSTELPVYPPTTSECTKLKGIYWPGMDIFDSATPEMRRKRNQKKDVSVVEQLELNSQEVEPTELIFTPQGSFKRQRRISSSNTDESSPVRDTTPSRSQAHKPVLADMDVNGGRRRTRQKMRPTYQLVSHHSYDEVDDHMDYGYGERRKRAFDVFQDQEVSFTRPAPMNFLTSTYTRPSTPTFPPYKAYHDPFAFDNKENIIPAYHAQQVYEQDDPHGYHYSGFGHDGAFGQQGVHQNPLYNSAFQHHNEEVDDQRTLTAPPSPSSG